ncbi:MAG: hypothetical protein ABWY00_06835 [Dongiaceae bacterium]
MTDELSLDLRLYGTAEKVEPPRLLAAGPLTAELEAGNLRYIRYDGIEIIRAISFIVRDKDWGTYNPVISNLSVAEEPGGFRVSYDAVARDADQSFSYKAEIRGSKDGKLVFSGKGSADTDFLTNRTGFVILHPIAGVAGEPVDITHVDGRAVKGKFPADIDPVQPMMALRALTHEAAPGLRVTCLMEGDTYEMEDQRNWTDASYKTYVRPLALPWPYTLALGEKIDQAITLTVTGKAEAAAKTDGITLSVGGRDGVVPPLGIGLDPEDVDRAMEEVQALRQIGVHHLICHYDPRRGHDERSLAAQLDVAEAIGAEPWLEAVIASVDGFTEELAELGRVVDSLGAPFATVLVSPAPDLKCTLPGSPWPACPPLDELYRAARKAFPKVRLGGGMFSYFTELNRKRPPVDLVDVVSFTTTAMVHAGDDRSVMETLEALPAIAASTAKIAASRPYLVGPSAIGMRANPYGDQPKSNPGNIRQAMNLNDPRQRSLLGAAWNLGYFARFAYGKAGAISLGGLAGAFGVLHTTASYPQPWYDDHGGLFPVFHVLRGLAALRGSALRKLDVSTPSQIQGIAAERADGTEIWLANLTGAEKTVRLKADEIDIALLDADTFRQASEVTDALDRWAKNEHGREIRLSPYAVARIRMR